MYEHVVDETIRQVLNGDVSEDTIRHALTQTLLCALEDLHNEGVPYEITLRRLELAEEASSWWNKEYDTFKTVETLREYWSV